MKEARDRIISAILGLVLLLSTFIILNTLNPELTVLRAPTTTVGGFSMGTFGTGPPNEPCHEIKFYQSKNFKRLFAAYSNDAMFWDVDSDGNSTNPDGVKRCNLDKPDWWNNIRCNPKTGDDCGGKECAYALTPDVCLSMGSEGWWITDWGKEDAPIQSVKIDGGCVVNSYQKADCTGTYNTISMTDPNLGGYAMLDRTSVKVIERIVPEPPEVVNCPPGAAGCPSYNKKKDSTGDTYQCDISGVLKNNGNAAYTRVYVLYGTEENRLSMTFPDKDLTFPDPTAPWSPSGPIPPIGWGKEAIMIEEVGSWGAPPKEGTLFTYTVTGLATSTPDGTPIMYYWKVKAVSDVGKYDVADDIATFTIP